MNHAGFPMNSLILFWYGSLSLISLVLYWQDKSAAKSNRWRTREANLHWLALMGGWPGAWLAQHLVRHKSRKGSFQTVFWFTVAINIIVLLALIQKFGTTI